MESCALYGAIEELLRIFQIRTSLIEVSNRMAESLSKVSTSKFNSEIKLKTFKKLPVFVAENHDEVSFD